MDAWTIKQPTMLAVIIVVAAALGSVPAADAAEAFDQRVELGLGPDDTPGQFPPQVAPLQVAPDVPEPEQNFDTPGQFPPQVAPMQVAPDVPEPEQNFDTPGQFPPQVALREVPQPIPQQVPETIVQGSRGPQIAPTRGP